jgi:fatty-acyl-CoA synthase
MGKLLDGWLDTGDLARVDEDGFVYLTGRAKDLIIRGGHNIDPAVIEDALLSHPDVVGALAVGRPDKHAGEVPVAYVTVAPGADTDAAALETWAREQIVEQAAAPKDVIILDALPLTDVGKPYKLALRARATQSVIEAELAGVDGVQDIATGVEDGAAVATIAVRDDGAADEVTTRLSQYTISYRISS